MIFCTWCSFVQFLSLIWSSQKGGYISVQRFQKIKWRKLWSATKIECRAKKKAIGWTWFRLKKKKRKKNVRSFVPGKRPLWRRGPRKIAPRGDFLAVWREWQGNVDPREAREAALLWWKEKKLTLSIDTLYHFACVSKIICWLKWKEKRHLKNIFPKDGIDRISLSELQTEG